MGNKSKAKSAARRAFYREHSKGRGGRLTAPFRDRGLTAFLFCGGGVAGLAEPERGGRPGSR